MWIQTRNRIVRLVLALSMMMCLGAGLSVSFVEPAAAQYYGLDAFSPMVWLPTLEAEATVRGSWVNLGNGSLTGLSGGSLRDHFKLNQTAFFVDTTVRLQLGRFSVRGTYEPRDLAAFVPVFPGPDIEARFSYSGIRIGGDLDIIQWNRTRVGMDIDYDLYSPQFTFPILNAFRARTLRGENAFTMGFHVTYNPLRTLFGLSAIAQFKARWPISGTQVTDWEVSGGLASPTTVIGSWSLQSGYRNTQISFNDYRGLPHPRFDGTIQCWFTELAYYY